MDNLEHQSRDLDEDARRIIGFQHSYIITSCIVLSKSAPDMQLKDYNLFPIT
jgi:hypothetical protein